MPFRLKSNYVPPVSTNARLEDYIHSLKIEAAEIQPTRTTFQNLSAQQRQALRDLSGNRDLVINKLTKGPS